MKNIAILLGICAILSCMACSPNTSDTKDIEKFQVIKPLVKDTVYQTEYVAEINAFQNVEVRTQIKGFIEAIHVDEGQNVSQGQLLFTISSKSYQQELQKANATLKVALAELKTTEIELENTLRLFEKNIISKSELDLAKAKVEAMNAHVSEVQSEQAKATLNLSFTQIRAPFNGIINRILNKTGSLVEEGALLTSISNNQEVFAYFHVSERDYLDYVTSGQKEESKTVSLILANNDLYPHKGLIETTESEFDKSTGNIAFRAKFPNPEQILKHGSSGKVLVYTELKHAMVIPQKSTFEVQENTYVYLVNKNNQVKAQKVVPLFRLPNYYIIGAGLKPEDQFVYEGIQRVKDGDQIIPEVIQSSQITKL